MVTHAQLWRGIEELAWQRRVSVSGLAKLAGLDPTTFNASKRIMNGVERWPSTETLVKALIATNTTLRQFAEFIELQPEDQMDEIRQKVWRRGARLKHGDRIKNRRPIT